MTCPRCGKPTVQGAGYCGECGTKLPAETMNLQTILKKGEKELDVAAKTAGDGIQSVIDEVVRFFK